MKRSTINMCVLSGTKTCPDDTPGGETLLIDDESRSTLRLRTLRGVSWSVAGRVGLQGIGFVLSIILARLLSPESFGLFAMVVVFSGFTAILLDSGLADAIVQRTDLDDDHVKTVCLFSAGLGIVASLVFFTASGGMARFYGKPELGPVARVLALNFVASGGGVVPRALLRRGMQFRPLALIEVATTLVSGVVAVGLSLKGAGALGLAISSVIGTTLTTILLWLACPWRFRGSLGILPSGRCSDSARDCWDSIASTTGAKPGQPAGGPDPGRLGSWTLRPRLLPHAPAHHTGY